MVNEVEILIDGIHGQAARRREHITDHICFTPPTIALDIVTASGCGGHLRHRSDHRAMADDALVTRQRLTSGTKILLTANSCTRRDLVSSGSAANDRGCDVRLWGVSRCR